MYKFLVLIVSLISLQSCGQNSTVMDEEVQKIFGNLYKDVKQQDKRLNYQALVFIGGCNYELLINDYPVDRYFGPGNGAASGSVPINLAILKPGNQTWKIRVFPVRDQKEINGDVTMVPRQFIEEGARIELDIEGVCFKENGNIENRFGKVVKFEALLKKDEKTGQNILADAGKPYTEYSGTFQAEVPYNLKGWANGEDLSKVESTVLKEKLLNKYKQYHDWLQNRKLNEIATSRLHAEKEIAQSFFYDKKSNENFTNNFLKMWGQKNLQMQPIENFKVMIYGNGKIATLIDEKDGGSPLWGIYEVDKNNFKHNTYLLYFQIPKGKEELELIR